MTGYGCKWGLPHDMTLLHDGPRAKWERCMICNRTFRWTKGFKGRIDNVEYLKAHARNYAQQGGATERLFVRLYQPERYKITL
jgi:hypothetical protein